MSLYHRDIFMPEAVNAYCGRTFKLVWTKHAMRACLDDKLGIIDQPPRMLSFRRENVVEAEMLLNGKVTWVVSKLVVRIPYPHSPPEQPPRDLVLTLFTDGLHSPEITVGTVWTNLATDTHTTLNKHVYDTK